MTVRLRPALATAVEEDSATSQQAFARVSVALLGWAAKRFCAGVIVAWHDKLAPVTTILECANAVGMHGATIASTFVVQPTVHGQLVAFVTRQLACVHVALAGSFETAAAAYAPGRLQR